MSEHTVVERCANYSNLTQPISNFSGREPFDGVVCPYISSHGADLSMELFTVAVIGGLALGLGIYQESPVIPVVLAVITVPVLTRYLPGFMTAGIVLVVLLTIAAGLYTFYNRHNDVI